MYKGKKYTEKYGYNQKQANYIHLFDIGTKADWINTFLMDIITEHNTDFDGAVLIAAGELKKYKSRKNKTGKCGTVGTVL
jgi:hypothetical protein